MKNERGQAFITLIIIAALGIIIATTAAIIIVINSQSGMELQQGIVAYDIAESGAENALLHLLRNPEYTGEANLAVGQGTVNISVENVSGIYTITSQGILGNYKRTVQIMAHYDTDNVLRVDKRMEAF
jgi:hypothetical protein